MNCFFLLIEGLESSDLSNSVLKVRRFFTYTSEIEKNNRLCSFCEVVETKRWFALADFSSQGVDR